MPSRSFPFPIYAHLPTLRYFHYSAIRRAGSEVPNHYETLHIPTNASASEVKKSFYALSKTHHPDRNPDDPHASTRFVQLSDAYAILRNPEKRQKYDRELSIHTKGRLSTSSLRTAPGSHSSTNPAGGRSPSGLSTRRTQFRGPPSSFYRSGGWGEHSAKRRAAQDNGAPGAEAPPDYNATGPGGGMGHGQSPFGHNQTNDVPHFDREGHFRTQENHQQRWQKRRRLDEEFVPAGDLPRSTLANFIFVTGIISLGVLIPSLIFEKFSSKKTKRE